MSKVNVATCALCWQQAGLGLVLGVGLNELGLCMSVLGLWMSVLGLGL